MTEATPPVNPRTLALGVVIYQPDAGLLQRLQQALDAGFSVYLFDNSPHDDGSSRDFARGKPRCHYTTCGKNLGLGVGISAVCSQAHYDGFSALIFFDQDTVFEVRTVEFAEQFFTRYQDKSREYSAVVFNAKDHASSGQGQDDWTSTRDVTMAISSGTMFFLKNLRKMNWHNATYFVDCVDYEFCLNSERHGFKIAEFSKTPGFDHLSEQPDKVYRFLGRNHAIRRYAASRVRGTLWASTRLALTALRFGHFRFSAKMLRSMCIYASFQIIARLIRHPTPAAPVSR